MLDFTESSTSPVFYDTKQPLQWFKKKFIVPFLISHLESITDRQTNRYTTFQMVLQNKPQLPVAKYKNLSFSLYLKWKVEMPGKTYEQVVKTKHCIY